MIGHGSPAARQPSAGPVVIALLVAIGAAMAVGMATTRWAASAIDIPVTDGLITGIGPARPERPLVGAAPSPNCAAFDEPFARLAATLGDTMGSPAACPQTDPITADTIQRTSTGLAIFRHHSQTPTFTDGYRRWALNAGGLIAWEGEARDPPE